MLFSGSAQALRDIRAKSVSKGFFLLCNFYLKLYSLIVPVRAGIVFSRLLLSVITMTLRTCIDHEYRGRACKNRILEGYIRAISGLQALLTSRLCKLYSLCSLSENRERVNMLFKIFF